MQPIIELIARHQVTALLPCDAAEEALSRGVIAGALAASKLLLTPEEFERLVTACDIDRSELPALLALAQSDSESDTTSPDIEV